MSDPRFGVPSRSGFESEAESDTVRDAEFEAADGTATPPRWSPFPLDPGPGPEEFFPLVALAGTGRTRRAALILRAILERGGRRFGLVDPRGWTDGDFLVVPHEPGPDDDGWNLSAALDGIADRGCDGALVILDDDAPPRSSDRAFEWDALLVVERPASEVGGELESEALRLERRRLRARLARKIRPGGRLVIDARDPFFEVLGASNLRARRVAFSDRPGERWRLDAERLVGLSDRGEPIVVPIPSRVPGDYRAAGAFAAILAAAWGVGAESLLRGFAEGLARPDELAWLPVPVPAGSGAAPRAGVATPAVPSARNAVSPASPRVGLRDGFPSTGTAAGFAG